MTDLAHSLDVLRIILRHSHDQPVKGETIETLTGVPTRTVAEIAMECQKRGFAVCSGSQGYFMAKNEEEFFGHLEKEHRRALALLEKVSDAKVNYIEQITLFEPAAEVEIKATKSDLKADANKRHGHNSKIDSQALLRNPRKVGGLH